MIRSPHRDALRLLYVLKAGGEQLENPAASEEAMIFKGEARLLAFDFWMRNPDYLAAELLDLFEATGDPAWLSEAEAIIDNGEPDLRRVPMIRYFFGAYERLDDALSLLRSRDLVRITGIKGSGDKVRETHFILTKLGYELCADAIAQEPVLQWYDDRSLLVARVAGDKGGAALKHQQYQRASYAETKLGGVIPSIAEEVRQRVAAIRAA
ncbi:hypothetical protein WL80_12625 [Burkholderia ubonensis]|uniref:hypothetical protein n=1 Tax=Burkholderia ubonensis TaxID=101571 RepID=UPI0007598168|nr:hypothetical protein [Burkholderia ubonensis]KWC42410.1 hypothetical protein WL51_03470 [Burkholderia ubonensis]KWE92351.1 hypothetical protein WL80_12625 [Burkholderia ubonensis]